MSLDTPAMNNDTLLSRSTHGTTPVTPADSRHELLHEHPRFLYDDGNVEFQVESTLYKLHRFFFSHYSPYFRTRFSQPESESEPGLPPGWECIDGPDGIQAFVNYDERKTMFEPPSPVLHGDSDVIVLEDIKTEEFDALLSIFYPEDLDLGDLSTQSEWTSVLRLSTLYSFSTLTSRAYRELSALVSPLDRLILARQYDYEPWVDIALRDLITRDEPLRADELRQMSYDDIAFVMAAREGVRGSLNAEHAHERIEEYLARRRYESQSSESSSSGTVEESSTSRSNSSLDTGLGGGDERTELGEGDEVHVKVEEEPDDDVLGLPLVAQETGGGPSRERHESGGGAHEDDEPDVVISEDEGDGEVVMAEPEPVIETKNEAAKPVADEPTDAEHPVPEAVHAATHARRRSTVSPIPEQSDESRASNASPADEHLGEPAPLSSSPELVTIPLEYVPLPSSVRSGTPSPEEITRPKSTISSEAAVPTEEVKEPAAALSSNHVSQPAIDNVEDGTLESAPDNAAPVEEVQKSSTPPPVQEIQKTTTPPPADEEPTSAPVPEQQDPRVQAEEDKKRREEDEAKAREDAIWAEFERETKLREETAKALAEEREKANATPPPARPSLWGALARSPSASPSVTETSATAATASFVPRPSPSRSSSMSLSFSGAAPGAPSLWSRFSYLSAKPPSRSSSPARRGSVSSVTVSGPPGHGSRSSSLARTEVGSPPNTADLHDALQDRAVVAGV